MFRDIKCEQKDNRQNDRQTDTAVATSKSLAVTTNYDKLF